MTVSRWKIMACTLGLSVGGLAIVAGPMNNRLNAQFDPAGQPSAYKPTPQPTEPPPIAPFVEKPGSIIEATQTVAPIQQVQEIGLPNVTFGPSTFPTPQVGTEMLPMPRPINDRLEFVADSFAAPPMPVAPMSVPPEPVVRNVPVPAGSAQSPAEGAIVPTVTPQRVPMVVTEQTYTLPSAPAGDFDAPPQYPEEKRMVVAPVVPPSVPQVLPVQTYSTPSVQQPTPAPAPPAMPIQQVSATTARLKMLMRLGDGKPRFEIRTSDSTELLFKVYAEKVEMQSAPKAPRPRRLPVSACRFRALRRPRHRRHLRSTDRSIRHGRSPAERQRLPQNKARQNLERNDRREDDLPNRRQRPVHRSIEHDSTRQRQRQPLLKPADSLTLRSVR